MVRARQQRKMLLLLALILPASAIAGLFDFCTDKCQEPYCYCKSGVIFSKDTCHDGYSGYACQCPFSRSNIADSSWLFPDTNKGSLATTSTENGQVFVGTWTSAYESHENGNFESWEPHLRGNDSTNVWSLTKTDQGTKFGGTPDGILRRSISDANFQLILANDGVHGTIVSVQEDVFAGTFNGLLWSPNDGVDWLTIPSSCAPYDIPPSDEYKPPPSGMGWCNESVTKILHIPQTNQLVAFYTGYGGAHVLDLRSANDPSLEPSWTSLPMFQNADNGDTGVCSGGYCQVGDAVMFHGHLYVALMSQALVRIHMMGKTKTGVWETVPIQDYPVNPQGIGGLAVANNGKLYASTAKGLYFTDDGNEWTFLDMDACSDRNTPPYMNGGLALASDKELVVGTKFGPWLARI